MKRWLLIIACLLAPIARGADLEAASGDERVTLVELFTSEGCSSCPPAEAWMNRLQDDPRLWRQLVPVAFHVDYWDYIGWPDRFAARAHSERQREYARQGRVSTVYTPGLVKNGREWRGWFRRPVLEIEAHEPAGRLAIEVSGETLRARFLPAASLSGPLLNVALLGFDLETTVTAGENHGRTLEHGFVVLGFSSAPMRAGDEGLVAETRLPAARVASARTAVAAWVSTREDLTPRQATGGWLTR